MPISTNAGVETVLTMEDCLESLEDIDKKLASGNATNQPRIPTSHRRASGLIDAGS